MTKSLYTYRAYWDPSFWTTLDNYRKPNWGEWGIHLSLDGRRIGFGLEFTLAGVLVGINARLRGVEVSKHYDGKAEVIT